MSQVDELKPAASRFRRNVQADDRAQPHAVAMSNVGEIQHDPSPGLNQLVDLGSKNVSALDHQASGATHRSDVWLYIDDKAELGRSAGGELRHNRAKINEKEPRGKRVPLAQQRLLEFQYHWRNLSRLESGAVIELFDKGLRDLFLSLSLSI